MKYLQVRLDDSEWKAVAMEAIRCGKSISELVRGVLCREFGSVHGEVEGVVEVAPVERKVVSVESKPVDDGYVALELKSCVKCKGKVAVADAERTRDGKYLCRDCADDLRVANA